MNTQREGSDPEGGHSAFIALPAALARRPVSLDE
jgi:hypothetical protein